MLATLPLALLLAAADPIPSPATTPVPAVATAFDPLWDQLAGEWTGEGTGEPGVGLGTATFLFELDRNVIVRRSRSDYPASANRPATHHQDLMVISPSGRPTEARAVYFDNEGHVLQYAAAWSPDGKTLAFLSPTGGPRFRLAYRFENADSVLVSFEVAPPGSGEFKTYVSGVMRRVTRGKLATKVP